MRKYLPLPSGDGCEVMSRFRGSVTFHFFAVLAVPAARPDIVSSMLNSDLKTRAQPYSLTFIDKSANLWK